MTGLKKQNGHITVIAFKKEKNNNVYICTVHNSLPRTDIYTMEKKNYGTLRNVKKKRSPLHARRQHLKYPSVAVKNCLRAGRNISPWPTVSGVSDNFLRQWDVVNRNRTIVSHTQPNPRWEFINSGSRKKKPNFIERTNFFPDTRLRTKHS